MGTQVRIGPLCRLAHRKSRYNKAVHLLWTALRVGRYWDPSVGRGIFAGFVFLFSVSPTFTLFFSTTPLWPRMCLAGWAGVTRPRSLGYSNIQDGYIILEIPILAFIVCHNFHIFCLYVYASDIGSIKL